MSDNNCDDSQPDIIDSPLNEDSPQTSNATEGSATTTTSASSETPHESQIEEKKQNKKEHSKEKKDDYISTVLSMFSPSPPPHMRTSETDPLKVDFVQAEFPNFSRLGMCMCPGRCKKVWRRDLVTDLISLTWHKTDAIVTLVATSELEYMGIPHFFQEIEKLGMQSLHCPIPDKWIPESMDLLVSLVDVIVTNLKAGKCLVVHCNAGKGRTGLICSAVLVTFGYTPDQAITLIRSCRDGTIRNPAQIIYLNMFVYSWEKFEKKRKEYEKTQTERSQPTFRPKTLSAQTQQKGDEKTVGKETDDLEKSNNDRDKLPSKFEKKKEEKEQQEQEQEKQEQEQEQKNEQEKEKEKNCDNDNDNSKTNKEENL